MSRPIRRFPPAIASALLATASAFSLAPTAMAQATDPQATDDIVVTAERRSESIQKVPMSITAISPKTLERQGARTLADVARAVPGLAVVTEAPGQNTLVIRGVSSDKGLATTGFYLDDTPLSLSRFALDAALFDLARVEVLKGPQGTLFGSGSMGGTVRYITNQPDSTRVSGLIGGTASVTKGSGVNGELRSVINLPIVADHLALRVNAFYRNMDGYIDRLAIDPNNYIQPAPNAERQKNVNTEHTWGARAALAWTPVDGITVLPSIYHQETKLAAPFVFDRPPGSFDNRIQVRDVAEPSSDVYTIYNLTLKARLSDFELLSSTSYLDRNLSVVQDVSKLVKTSFAPVTSVYPIGYPATRLNHYFTEEARVSYQGSGPVTGIVGVYYSDERDINTFNLPITAGFNSMFHTPFGAQTLFYQSLSNEYRKNYAAFGELRYHVTGGLSLTGGLRGFKYDVHTKRFAQGLFNGGVTSADLTSSASGVTPRMTLSYQATPTILTYATASKGFRGGGGNTSVPAALCAADLSALGTTASALQTYGPDSLWNYEIGGKTSWFDRHLTVNAAIYKMDWDKVQQTLRLQRCGFNVVANFGKAVSKGGEIEVGGHFGEFSLNAALGYNDSHLTHAVGGSQGSAGDRLLNAPEWTISGSADYRHRLSDRRYGYARLDYSYVSTSNVSYVRSSNYYQRPGFALVNARIGMEVGQYDIALFVQNMLDKLGETAVPAANSADLPTTRGVTVNRPRTIGVDATAHF